MPTAARRRFPATARVVWPPAWSARARRESNVFEFEMEMGVPRTGESFAVTTSRGAIQGMPVSTGNPHFVVFTPEFPERWQQLGQEIGGQKVFTEGVNVE